MRDRRRFYRNGAIALAGAFGVLGVVYLWLAFGPTGYGRFEKRYAEAIERRDDDEESEREHRAGASRHRTERARGPVRDERCGAVF